MKFLSYIFFIIFFLSPISSLAFTSINVTDQSSFNELSNSLNRLIRSGEKDIEIRLLQGFYIAKEDHFRIQGINIPDVNIRIVGKDATIVPDGYEYRNGDKYVGQWSENNSWMSGSLDIKTWSDVHYADGLVEIIDVEKKQCRLKSKEPLALIANGASHILIPHWFQSSVYKIDRISGNFIYFTVKDLKISYKNGYNINDDYNFGRNEIRFKLFNAIENKDCIRVIDGKVSLPPGVESVREGRVRRFFTIQNNNFNTLEISGIKFLGGSYADFNSVILFHNVNSRKIWIHDCYFSGIRNSVISIESSHNIVIEKNIFTNCYYYGIKIDNNSMNTKVIDNCLTNMANNMNGKYCIHCEGENYLISGNKLQDFGFGGIGVGVHYKRVNAKPCYGVVENNELFYTDKFIKNIKNYGIMDCGAIRIATKNNGVIIRNNFIHNFTGIFNNFGIFCDDGAYNFQIYGNVITNVANSYCIASRREPNVEISKTPESSIEKANVNNVIRDNILDGGILFVGHEDKDNRCVKGANYILMKQGENAPHNIIKNIINAEDDIPLEYVGTANGKFYITSQSYRKLKKSKSWNYLRKHLGKY